MTIFGSDVSHFDAPDTRPMFADGIVFQTHKAGGDKDDPELAQWWTYARGSRDRVLLGAYWVLYPGNPKARAEKFIARLDGQCPGWRNGPFILQADCEEWDNNPATVPSVAEINAFCDRLVELAPKLRPIGYLPAWVYPDVGGYRYPVWRSWYVTGTGHYRDLYPGDSSSKWASYGKVPAILQYSSKATIGNQTTCDANAFRGTLAELMKLLAPGWTTETEDGMTTQEVVTGNAEYNKVTMGTDAAYPGATYSGNEGGRNVWDRQAIPIPLLKKKGPAWQAIEALQNDAIGKNAAIADLTTKINHLSALLEAHVAGLIETAKPNG